MNAQQANLNLARKWRPQNFEHIIGQDTSVRMLKNSLYLKKFFPVYLFAGQRGCGKTSTARVFAAAVNCMGLSTFQTDPTAPIPCLTCASCTAMASGNHADFIEIDAASHTGVDNVRQIIESSSYMPLSGQKKIYLIDEAHMLSKAAFNAFLKILEEPPTSVIFILATTEVPKIPATVLSRCFQVIFNPLQSNALKNHLINICTQESVSAEPAALELIIAETEGSARDAINLLERVRFSGDQITEQTVLSVLGKISVTDLVKLFQLLLTQKPAEVLANLATIGFEQRSAQLLWDMIIQLARHLIWVKYGVPASSGTFAAHADEIAALAQGCSINRLTAMLNLLWNQEELFQRTNKKHIFLELVLLQICQQVNVVDLEGLISSYRVGTAPARSYPPQTPAFNQAPSPTQTQAAPTPAPQQAKPIIQPPTAPASEPEAQAPQAPAESQPTGPWQLFVAAIDELKDLLLASIVRQCTFVKKDHETNRVVIQLSADSAFFKNKIEETSALWQPILSSHFEGATGFTYLPGPAAALAQPRPQPQPSQPLPPAPPRPVHASTPNPYQQRGQQREQKEYAFITIKNPSQWPKASLLLRHFPGKIKKVKQSEPQVAKTNEDQHSLS